MKIDKSNPKHWLILLWSGILLIIALLLRPLMRLLHKRPLVVFYGHKLNGNLLELYEYGKQKVPDYEYRYLTIDPVYERALRKTCPDILSGLNLNDMLTLVSCRVIITDHGLHHFALLKKLTNIKFVDVWHGIAYKGFDSDDFRALKDYDQVWVSSPYMKRVYVNKLKFKNRQVKAVGYARAERLRNYPLTKKAILNKYGLKDIKTVLIAPTWQQDDKGRDILPYSASLRQLIQSIQSGYKGELQIIFRAHLNVKQEFNLKYKNVKFMPYTKYPVAEDFLTISDVLITDWSSIAFDALAINLPVIYFDVPAPFKKGFILGPEFRFGDVPGGLKALTESCRTAINKKSVYQKKHHKTITKTIHCAYGSTLSGDVCKDSFKLLKSLVGQW